MQDLCCSARAFLSSTSPGSLTPGEPPAARHSTPPSVLPATVLSASASPSSNHFGAQSLRFRSGSVAPCPTLKPNVTASAPRTRYGRSATPYPAGLRSRYTLTAYKGSRLASLPSGRHLCLRSTHQNFDFVTKNCFRLFQHERFSLRSKRWEYSKALKTQNDPVFNIYVKKIHFY